MSFKTAKDKIKLLLDGLTGDGADKLFSQCFDYFEPQPSEYPCAMVGFLGGGSERMMDSEYNETRMPFVVRAYFKNNNDSATQDTMLSVLDSLLVVLRSQNNLTLGSSAQMMEVSPEIEAFYTDRESEPVVGFDITVSVLKLNQT